MTSEESKTNAFDRQRHVHFFAYSLRQLPGAYGKLDTNRLTLVHFCVHALDLLGVWEDSYQQEACGLDKQAIIDWIYSFQIPSSEDYPENAGFTGGTYLGDQFGQPESSLYHFGHIAMNYTALATLKTLGDDWSRLNQSALIASLRQLQLPDGSFSCISVGSEHDMRFLYCACCISHMLNDWSGLDRDLAVRYIRECKSFDGAIALLPGQEGHGGSTFCAVASLVLMERTDILDTNGWRDDLIHWCVSRQVCGMQGRPSKNEDTCYSYWIGGTLHLLGRLDLLDHAALRSYVLRCQTKVGGFGKIVGVHPDVLHAYYSLAYLSMSQPHTDNDNDVELKSLNTTLGIALPRAELFDPVFP